jgi:hypothetical protein
MGFLSHIYYRAHRILVGLILALLCVSRIRQEREAHPLHHSISILREHGSLSYHIIWFRVALAIKTFSMFKVKMYILTMVSEKIWLPQQYKK